MKKSKQTKASKRVDGADNTLSNLPDPILHLILSGLPTTEEIIRTSILSRRWRYLWTSIPSIDIDCSQGSKSVKESRENKFTEFVYWVLLKRPLDLDSFRLACSYCYSMSTVGRWIHAAVTRNVKQLHLMFRPGKENIEMPHCLLTCGSLEVLRLFLLRGRLSLPDFTGFPSLRVLELKDVTLFDADLVQAFFKSLTLLEDLSLIDCAVDRLEFLCISCLKLKNLRIDNRKMIFCGEYLVCGDLRISCPKVVFLESIGNIAYKFFFDSLDSLEKAVIHPEVDYPSDSSDSSDSEPEPEPERMDDTLCELFARISHVEFLSISGSFAAKCIDPEVDVPVSLLNLKTLELTVDYNHYLAPADALQFLKRFPDLESLDLNIKWGLDPHWKLDDAATMRILTRQLKKVAFLNFNGNHSQLNTACFFLEHGNALEEMVFIWRNEAKFHEGSVEATKKLSNFHKASSTVKLTARLKPRTFSWYCDISSKV